MEEDSNYEPILQFFEFGHLRTAELRHVSEHFQILARTLISMLPKNAQRDASLQRLLEAKDAAVRAKVMVS